MIHLKILLPLIINYYVFDKHIKVVQFFNCRNSSDNIELHNYLSSLGVIANVISMHGNIDMRETVASFVNVLRPTAGILLDFNCPQSSELIKLAAESGCFNAKNKWLIFEENDVMETSQLIDQLHQTDLYVNAEISYLNFAEGSLNEDYNSTMYPIFDVYNNAYRNGGNLNITLDRYYIYRNPEFNLLTESILQKRTKYENRADMSDLSMRVATVSQMLPSNATQTEILDYMLGFSDMSKDVPGRFASHTVVLLKDIFRYRVWLINYDVATRNDSYGGALGAMVERDVDYVMSSYILTLARYKYVSAVLPYVRYKGFVYFRTPRTVSVLGDDLFRPFSNAIWLCLSATILAVAILLKIVLSLETCRHNRKLEQRKWKKNEAFSQTLLITFAAYCQQGAHLVPTHFSGKCIYIFLFFLGSILYNTYTSILVSSLVSGPSKTDITDVYKLVDSSLTFRAENLPYVKAYLERTRDPQTRYLFEKKLKSNSSDTWTTAEQGIQLVRRGGYAFHADGAIAYPIIAKMFKPNELCDLNVINLRSESTLTICLRKHSPFLEIFRIKYIRIIEVGILSKHRRIWDAPQPPCLSNSFIFSVGWEYTAPIFLFMAMANVVSLFILICENVVFAYKSNQAVKNRKYSFTGQIE